MNGTCNLRGLITDNNNSVTKTANASPLPKTKSKNPSACTKMLLDTNAVPQAKSRDINVCSQPKSIDTNSQLSQDASTGECYKCAQCVGYIEHCNWRYGLLS